jgi:tetratricopeptide (TPR) repeat protein
MLAGFNRFVKKRGGTPSPVRKGGACHDLDETTPWQRHMPWACRAMILLGATRRFIRGLILLIFAVMGAAVLGTSRNPVARPPAPAVKSAGVDDGFAETVKRLGVEHAGAHAQAALELLNKAMTLGKQGRGSEEIAVYDDLVTRFGVVPERAVRETVARALFNKGARLNSMHHEAEALASYDELISLSEKERNIAREMAAKASVDNAGRAEIISRFDEAQGIVFRELVAKASLNKCYTLHVLGRDGEALSVCDAMLIRYRGDTTMALRAQYGLAFVDQGLILGVLGRHAEALAAFDEAISQFDGQAALPSREVLASALYNKGYELASTDRTDDAIKVYDSVLTRYGTAPVSSLRE